MEPIAITTSELIDIYARERVGGVPSISLSIEVARHQVAVQNKLLPAFRPPSLSRAATDPAISNHSGLPKWSRLHTKSASTWCAESWRSPYVWSDPSMIAVISPCGTYRYLLQRSAVSMAPMK